MDASSTEDGSCGEGLHRTEAQTARPIQGFGGVGPGVRAQDQRGEREPGTDARGAGYEDKGEGHPSEEDREGDISPEDEVRKKLEKELKIRLTDQANEAQVKSGGSGRGLTLGDVADIKRK